MDRPPPLGWTIETSRAANAAFVKRFEASASECEAIARYLDVSSVASVIADVKVSPLSRDRFRLTGNLEAELCQESVVSLEPVPETVAEPISIEFWPVDQIAGDDDDDADEIVVSLEEEAPEPIEDGSIAIGRLVCELLAVSVNPYPRKEAESFEYDAEDGGRPNPFAVLQKLKPGSGAK